MKMEILKKKTKVISVLLISLLFASCSSDLDITKFTDEEISEKFSYSDGGVLYFKKKLYSGKIVKYNYVGGELEFELNYIDGKYDGIQKSYKNGDIYKEMLFKDKGLESYSLYFSSDGSKKEYLDSKGNVMILNNQKDTLNYLKINEDKTISYPIIHGDRYNKIYTGNESISKDSLIVFNDDETIIFKNLKNIHQVYPIKNKKIIDFGTPWENSFYFLISDSTYYNNDIKYSNPKRVFNNLKSDDQSINVFEQNLSSLFTLNTELVSKMTNDSYSEWENYTKNFLNGDSIKGSQIKLSINYDEEGLYDPIDINDLDLRKLNYSDVFVYSDSIKSDYYKQYIVYPEEITIRNGDSIQKYTYQFDTGNYYNKDYKGIHLSNIKISSRIEFKPNGSYIDIELLNVGFRLDNVINNKVYRNDYFHYIDDIDRNKDLGVLTSILKKKLDDGEEYPDLDYDEKFLFSTYLSDGRGTKINNINDYKLTSISSIDTSEGQFSGYDRYGDQRKNYLRVSKSIIPEIDKVVKYVNELEVKIPNTGLEFIKNNLIKNE
jgi:hypothetical protein